VKRIIVRPTFGLANRLWAVTSAWLLARRFQLPLAMLWQPGDSWDNHQWSDLFQNEIETLDNSEYEAAMAEGVPLASDWFNGTSQDDPETVIRRIREEGVIHDNGYYDLYSRLRNRGIRIRRCQRLRRKIYRELRPIPSIAKEVDEFVARNFRKRQVIGLHIRRGDAMSGPHREQYAPSTDAAFDRVIEERPGTHFYLSTDDSKTERRFRERYGDRIVTHLKEWVESEYNQPKAGQRAALVEMLLLSRTNEIFGTRWSTFGTMGAKLGGIRCTAAIEE
jgi:hypothetical protein